MCRFCSAERSLDGSWWTGMSHQEVLAAPGAVMQAEDVQQGRLAGARGSHDRDELARLDLERDPPQRVGLPGADRKRLLDTPQRHDRRVRIDVDRRGDGRGGASEQHVCVVPLSSDVPRDYRPDSTVPGHGPSASGTRNPIGGQANKGLRAKAQGLRALSGVRATRPSAPSPDRRDTRAALVEARRQSP